MVKGKKEEKIEYKIRLMKKSDYDEVFLLWKTIKGFAIRKIDDEKIGIVKFLNKNKTTCVVAVSNNEIVGSILCGNDGRQAYFYHVCVKKNFRKHGIANSMVTYLIKKLMKFNINKISLVAFKKNNVGNKFWKTIGFTLRNDINVYEKIINKNYSVIFN